ncbi:ComF family protein [Helicobacter saguini]|uniref:ComF family protein n=1 Tax=Helicobacter saguini TaxID=1548018 RepID=A0A347VXM8_9HELI|nr:hypothetical protein [Helicobacter saguini]MWV61567.1 ComF family protein [Helicobacter saguini]MWV67762.1 ComF family protein [Helicobacter saguini]MWV70770.1 ComF family protein [Helicobacter saguini]MWV72674.1 ComF family protein [Helicobacter saguini]TLD94523.1 ComF family protein [Helicobacter saguini]
MYCATCERFSFHIICKSCLNNLWYIDSKRELENGLKVFSSFALSEIKELVLSKNNVIGSRVLARLGSFGVKKFFMQNSELLFEKTLDSIESKNTKVIESRDFYKKDSINVSQDSIESKIRKKDSIESTESIKKNCAIVCVRNKQIGAYSHSAILAKCFKKFGFKVFYNALIAQNDVRFTSLSLIQRLKESRDFSFKIPQNFSFIIIVDDIITTGQTLFQASEIIKSNDKIPLFAWTLCDARY